MRNGEEVVVEVDVDDDVVTMEEEDELEDIICELDVLVVEGEVNDEMEEVEDEEEGEAVDVETLEVVVVVLEELVTVAR